MKAKSVDGRRASTVRSATLMSAITFLNLEPASPIAENTLRKGDVPFFASTVSCGFPSPAENDIETPLNLNEILVPKPAATFFVRAKGDSMTGAGIFDGDLLIIDRSIDARNNHVILAILNGEFTLKRFSKSGEKIFLLAENSKYKPTEVTEAMDFKVWGVATHCIHSLR